MRTPYIFDFPHLISRAVLLGTISFLVCLTAQAQVVVVNEEALVTNSGSTSYTLSGFDPGMASQLVVTASSEGNGAERTITSVTFGGTELTEIITANEGVQRVGIWFLNAPASQPGDIVVTWDGLTNGCGIAALSLSGAVDGAPSLSDSIANNNSLTLTTTSPDTFVIGTFVANAAENPTLGFESSDYELVYSGNVGSAIGATAIATVETPSASIITFETSATRPVVAAVGFTPIPPNSDPNAFVSPLSLFGDLTDLGSGAFVDSETVTIRNNAATNSLEVSAINITGTDADAFSTQNLTFPISLAPGERQEVVVSFDTERDNGSFGGNFDAQMEINTNDPDTPQTIINLSSVLVSDPDVALPNTSSPFGTVVSETEPLTIDRGITIENNGFNENLTLSTMITGPDAASYEVTTLPAEIFSGNSEQIMVTLTPGMQRDFSATLEITTNDPDMPLITVPLDATIFLGQTQIIVVGNDGAIGTKAFLEARTKADLVTVGTFANLTLDANQGELEQLNNAKLIIFDRNSSSANYRNIDQVEFWNSVTTTIIQTNVFIARGDRWGMVDGMSLNQGNGNFFLNGAEATITAEGATVLGLPEGPTDILADTGVNTGAHIASTFLGGGVLLASGPNFPADSTTPTTQIAYWANGVTNAFGDLYPGDRYLFGINDANSANPSLEEFLTPAGVNALLAIIGTEIDLKVPVNVSAVTRNDTGSLNLSWSSAAGSEYRILFTTDLSLPLDQWSTDTDNIPSGGITTTATTTNNFTEDKLFVVIEEL